MIGAHPWLSLDENLILRAGAGTGKTHALVSMALGLLGGLRRGQPVAPHQLWLLTFGEQAAGELRVRLRERLEKLAAGGPVAVTEPDLAAAAEVLGIRLPGPEGWRSILANLGAVNTKTLHGAGATLLQGLGGHALTGFEVLDAEAADALLTAAAEAAILSGCTAGDTASLLEDFGYRGPGELAMGLVDALREMRKKIADDGGEMPAGPAQGATLVPGVPALEPLLERARSALAQAAIGHGISQAARAAALLDIPAGHAPAAFLESAWGEIHGGVAALGKLRKHGASEARKAVDELKKLLGVHRAAAHTAAFGTLLGDVEERYRVAKSRRGALDFSDLCNLSRNLLRDDPAARRAAKAKVGALLLDETQDTSRVQFELCLLLCEARRAEAEVDRARPVADQIELERGVLCAVGDRKQSIYEFRGANVAVFEELAAAVIRSHGRTELLQASRRSRPELVGFVNRFFERSMQNGGPGVPGFGAEDALLDGRAATQLPAATLLRLTPVEGERADDSRLREARAVATRALALLRDPPRSVCEALGREPEPGDLALLFRRLAHVELFRGALAEAGLPGVLLGGDGFWERAEVLDAITLLSAVIDPDDGMTALALLRSPLCGIPDASVARVAFAAPAQRLSLRTLWKDLPAGLPADDRADLLNLGERLRELRRASRGLGASGLLRVAETAFGLRARYADPQCSTNLDKLDARVALWQAQGTSLAACVRRLTLLAREQPREPLAPAVDGSERAAVRLLSIHASKGLEFPVVFVVECGALPHRSYYPALYAREIGFGFKGRDPTGAWSKPAQYASVEETLRVRSEAEELRLLYVAATRAQELVFFSGELPRAGSAGTWRFLLDAHGAAAGLAVETLGGEAPVAGGPLFGAPVRALAPRPAIEAVLDESAPLPRILTRRLPLAASAAGDLWLCARRYQLRQLWQLEERPGLRTDRRAASIELPLDEDPRTLGSQAHRLLELIDFSHAARDLEGALREASQRVSPAGIDSQLLSEVRSVLSSRLGRQMLDLPPDRVLREVPFVLRLGTKPTLVATGSIDLLLVLDDRVVVLDYKRGPPQERASYEAQVRLYALAARELTGGVLPIHAGLWFLRAGPADPQTFEVSPEDLGRFRKEVVAAARTVAGRDARRSLFPGRELRHCRAIGCGFAARCHGGSGGRPAGTSDAL